ncbi:MAG: efflux RND transporter periplasmic adaptor subunit, partial [Paludibacteraceae bacterium]|nr:efflux RND transporter periplasmic adaptor subunit [Paludibacteraceae bacterium]
KGQKMFILAQTEYIAALANANAGVEVAKAQVRTEELEVEAEKILLDKNIISEHQYNVTCNELAQAKAQLAEAEANVVSAKNNLSYTVICAPCNGVVGDINYRQGALVGPTVSKPLTIVSDNSVIYAYSSINEKDYLYHMQHAGGKEKFIEKLPVKCQLILSNGEFYEQEGKIETVSGVVDRQTGAVNMRTAFPNAKGILASGGSATLELSVMENGIVIPRSATYEIQDKTYAYKITKQNNSYVALSTAVEVYRINDKEYLVEKGLSVGDTIAVEGVRKMTNNMEVKPVISALVASNDSVKAVSDSVKVLD